MAGVKHPGGSSHPRREGVSLQFMPASARDEQVAELDRPWIAEEGPLAVRVVRLETGSAPELLRGLAFDPHRTVTWDEDRVTVISPAPPDEQTVALESDVLVRERFSDMPTLVRIDYVKNGVWQASRYLAKESGEKNAGARHA